MQMEDMELRPMTVQEIARALGKELEDAREIEVISTDSRDIPPNSIFVALKGESFNGNLFAAEALRKGALYAVVDEDRDYGSDNIIKVASTRQAFLDIAGAYRRKFTPKVVAVTGSVGKTTTKEFIWTVLNSRYKTLKTEGNQNNEVGLPRTLLRLDETIEAAVLEMGMCALGEIEELTIPAQPTIGVITNIGVSHMEALGSRENILKAKMEIVKGMAEGSPLVLCGDNDLLSAIEDDRYKIITYGIKNESCLVRAVNCRSTGDSTEFDIVFGEEKYHVSIPCLGEHNVLNALAAFTVGLLLRIEPMEAAAVMAGYQVSGMRQRVVPHGDFTVVEDCYNASPDSMRAAVNAFSAMGCRGRRILVLADMLELGETAKELHQEIGVLVAQNPIHILACVGELGKNYAEGALSAGLQEAFHFEDKEELFQFLKGNVQEDDILWFKGSRGMKLEEVISRLYEEC